MHITVVLITFYAVDSKAFTSEATVSIPQFTLENLSDWKASPS
jgi:hypothetical protein